MTWIRPVRFGTASEQGKVAGQGTVDPYDTRTSAQQTYRAQRPYQGAQLWVGKGLLKPKPSAVDTTVPLMAAMALGMFFIMK